MLPMDWKAFRVPRGHGGSRSPRLLPWEQLRRDPSGSLDAIEFGFLRRDSVAYYSTVTTPRIVHSPARRCQTFSGSYLIAGTVRYSYPRW